MSYFLTPNQRLLVNASNTTRGFYINKFHSFIRYRTDATYERISDTVTLTNNNNENKSDINDIENAPEKKKNLRRGVMARRTEYGELEIIPTTKFSWYLLYICGPYFHLYSVFECDSHRIVVALGGWQFVDVEC